MISFSGGLHAGSVLPCIMTNFDNILNHKLRNIK